MSQTVTLPNTTTVTHTVTLHDITAVLTRLADNVDSWIPLGIQPPLPEGLVQAAERITAAMKICRPTAPTKQMPISQLVISLAVPGEDVTAKDLCDRLRGSGWNTTNQAISVALHRAAVRGLFERPRRGVYRLVTPESHPRLANPKAPADEPPAPSKERRHTHALAEVEAETPPT